MVFFHQKQKEMKNKKEEIKNDLKIIMNKGQMNRIIKVINRLKRKSFAEQIIYLTIDKLRRGSLLEQKLVKDFEKNKIKFNDLEYTEACKNVIWFWGPLKIEDLLSREETFKEGRSSLSKKDKRDYSTVEVNLLMSEEIYVALQWLGILKKSEQL